MDRVGCSWGLDVMSMACTVPRFNALWLLPLGLREGHSVCATTTREHTWFKEQNYRGCGDHHTWLAEQSMAGNGQSPRCVPCDKGCMYETFVGMYHKLVQLLFHFTSSFSSRRWTFFNYWRFWPSQRPPPSISLNPGRKLSNFRSSFGKCPVWCYPPGWGLCEGPATHPWKTLIS